MNSKQPQRPPTPRELAALGGKPNPPPPPPPPRRNQRPVVLIHATPHPTAADAIADAGPDDAAVRLSGLFLTISRQALDAIRAAGLRPTIYTTDDAGRIHAEKGPDAARVLSRIRTKTQPRPTASHSGH